MNQKVLYSVMGLAAMPMVQTVAQNQNWTGTTLTVAQSGAVSDGSAEAPQAPLSFNIGKLVPGNYNLAFNLTSKVYDVTVAVSGAKGTPNQVCNKPGSTAQIVNVAFQVEDATKDIVISLTSSDPSESGSGYSYTAPEVSLSFDFATTKTTLVNNAQALINTIGGYNYAKQEDVDAANALKTKANNVQSSYDDYKKYKLYAEKSTIQEEIDQLAAEASAKEAAYQNDQAYNRVNAAIADIKAKYNAAVAKLEEALVGAAAYLLDGANGAKADLNENINKKITEASSANYASHEAKTAVSDEDTNMDKIPTEDELNAIVNYWKGQATTNINDYNTLHGKVTTLQANLDAIVPASDAIAALYPKTDAQAAINAINTKVENAYNSAAQLSLDIEADVTAAQEKITDLEGKVNTANAEYAANNATTAAIGTLTTNLNAAKAVVNAKVSADGNYKAQDYYAAYIADIEADIQKFTSDAAAVYKTDGTGSAQAYNNALNTSGTQAKIDAYKQNAVAAVEKYDALQEAMADYQTDLDELRGKVEGLDIYTDDSYDYKTQLDRLQKRIKDIQKAIDEAKGKTGADHWNAMFDIDADADIKTDIAELNGKYQADQNQYDKDYLDDGLSDLATQITTFNATVTEATLGEDYDVFADAEAAINTKVSGAQEERNAIEPTDEDAAEKIAGLTAKVELIKAEQTALEAAANAVKAKVAANTSAQTTLAGSITGLQTKIGTFKTTYKIGQDDSTLGNRGKADGSITTEVGEIETALTALKTANNAVELTKVNKVDKTVATSGLANGLYDVEVEVVAQATGNASVNGTAIDYAAGTNTYPLTNVIVSDGTLTAAVDKDGVTVTVKKLTYHENDQLSTYNNVSEETPGLNNQYTALAAQETALETAALGIKTAVEANARTYTAATQAVTQLQTAELNTLKNLTNVTNALAESDDATAKKADPADFKVFETGLDAGKTYTAKKAAIDADIAAMSGAINASNAEETLGTKWQNNSITVGEGNEAKTYSISALTNSINSLKTEAEAESNNYEAYAALQTNNMSTLKPDTITIAAADLGDGAVAYYQGLKESYITGKNDILTAMQQSLMARTAVSTKSGFVSQIAALIEKVKVVKSDGVANKKKYDEQVAAYTETQTLWNSTYTEIAATDHSSKVQEWLDQLDAIQVILTAANEAVEANYPVGKSVAEAQDFAAIKASINDVKAQQSEAYNAQIAADNQAAHATFNSAIEDTKATLVNAIQERAKYSSTNARIEAAVTAAAAELDAALYSCPTDIETLVSQENTAFAAVQSPTVFNVDSYIKQALDIEQEIATALTTFKANVKTALNEFWTEETSDYAAKITAAKNDIASYKDEAKQDAFKDVEDQIRKGQAGVTNLNLTDIEAAVAALENIDNMLAADKDAAAVKDIELWIADAEEAYNEVKAYIESITIADDPDAQWIYDEYTEDFYTYYAEWVDYVKSQTDYSSDTHDEYVYNYLKEFIDEAGAVKTQIENAAESDAANTEAYAEVTAATALVEEKLAEATTTIAPYKYATSFAYEEQELTAVKERTEQYRVSGRADDNKDNLMYRLATISTSIETTLKTAFDTEKIGLAGDIAELKNQYNAYVAKNGLNETASGFKARIDALEGVYDDAAIKDLDDPADDIIQFDEIVAASDGLTVLQNNIADLESELLQANGNNANANVLADFQSQLQKLDETASLEGYDEWVGQQTLTLGGKTLQEQITALREQIADLRTAIEAEANIAFYKNNYQKEIDAIKKALDPVAEKIKELDDIFKANAAAYATLSAQIEELQGKIDAAKEKVGTYQYAEYRYTYFYYIEDYDWDNNLVGGAQKQLNDARNSINNANASKSLTSSSVVPGKASIENNIQIFLEESANSEIKCQRDDLNTNLRRALDYKYRNETYSNELWGRLQTERDAINGDIVALSKGIYVSYEDYAGSFDGWTSSSNRVYVVDHYEYYYYTLDGNGQRIRKAKTSDADYATHMGTVAAIQEKINALSTAVDNLAILGDANEDGRVNVLDYQKVLNMILDPTLQPMYDAENPIAKSQTDEELFQNLDINGSDVIEVGDLTAIVNYILNQNWNGYAAVKGFGAAGESLTMDITPVQQGVQRYAINLQNTEDYTAFQLDVVLPEGMKIVGQSLSDRAGQSHKLYSRAQQDGSIRLLASSVKGESFSGSEGAVLYIDVETTSDFKGGSVEMMNILFSDVYAQTRAFAIGNGGEATGIDITAAMQTLKQKVYDLGGRMMNGLKKGVNIIQGADGQTKKVVK